MTPFPWAAAMRFGLGILRLSPAEFWAMTPRELAAAYAGLNGGAGLDIAPGRDRLLEMMNRFPDEEKQHGRS